MFPVTSGRVRKTNVELPLLPTKLSKAERRQHVTDLIQRLLQVCGKTVLMVTHDSLVARQANTTLHLDKGVGRSRRPARRGRGRCLMKFSRLIWANLVRKKTRLVLTIGSFVVALFLFACWEW